MPISHLLAESFYHPPPLDGQAQVGTDPTVENVTVLANGLVINNTGQGRVETGQKIVLIDTDGGTDDSWAIFMALAAQRDSSNPGFKIVGITTVNGNTTVENVVNNVTRTLNTVNETTIPIYKGMDSSMIGFGNFKHLQDPPYNGHDGFGDANLQKIPSRIEPEHSVNAIIKFAETYKGQLSILCIGPLSNLAMALKLRPDIKNMIKEVYVLGGNTEGVGNVTVSSEFNFFVDPEAARVVLENLNPCPIIIVPWETTTKFATSSHEWRRNVLGNMRTQEIELLNKIEARILTTYTDNWLVSDAVLMACFINPNVVIQKADYHCNVETQRSLTRGMMVVDKTFIQQIRANATVILEIDQSLYESMLIWAAGGPKSQHSNRVN